MERKRKRIRNYHVVRKMIEAYFKTEFATERRLKSEEEELLKRVRAGMTVVRRNGSVAREGDLVSSIADHERRLDETLYRGKPRKDTLLRRKWEMLAELDEADKAARFTGLKVNVEWKRSRTWGHNPSAEVWVFSDGNGTWFPMLGPDGGKQLDSNGKPYMMTTWHRTGHASGCGYDKLSAAIQSAIGDCPTISRLIIENRKCWKSYAVDGKSSLPYLSISGKGVSTLRQLFCAFGEKPPIPGFGWRWDEGRNWDLIEVTTKGKV